MSTRAGNGEPFSPTVESRILVESGTLENSPIIYPHQLESRTINRTHSDQLPAMDKKRGIEKKHIMRSSQNASRQQDESGQDPATRVARPLQPIPPDDSEADYVPFPQPQGARILWTQVQVSLVGN